MIFRIIYLTIAVILTIFCLLKIDKKKKELQKYPDSIKKQLLRKNKFNMYSNYVSVIILISSGILISNNLFYILATTSIFFDISLIDYILQDEIKEKEEVNDENE